MKQMKSWSLLVIGLSCLAPGVSAEQGAPQASMGAEQQEGRRIFQQKCAVCHVPISAIAEPYATKLTKGLVESDERYIREIITNGSGSRMPGWKHTLQPTQIDNVIAYLKTLEKPIPTVATERAEP